MSAVENSGEKPLLIGELQEQVLCASYFSGLSKKKKNAESFTGSLVGKAVASIFWHGDIANPSLPRRVTVDIRDFL